LRNIPVCMFPSVIWIPGSNSYWGSQIESQLRCQPIPDFWCCQGLLGDISQITAEG
jgi:hypothetical protein